MCGFIVNLGLEYTMLYVAISRCEISIAIMLCGHFGLLYDWVGFLIVLSLCKWNDLYLFCKYLGLLVALLLL